MTTQERKTKSKSRLSTRLAWILLALAAVWIFTILTEERLVPVGQAAPGWRLKVAGGAAEMLDLDSLRGKVVVLDFRSLGCPPCMAEARDLESVWRKMGERGVVVVGVAAWGESADDVREFKERKNLTYPMLLGTAKMVSAYKVSSLPTLYVIDKDGKVAASHQGYWHQEGITEAVAEVLSRGQR
jgi:peroxiredoxin